MIKKLLKSVREYKKESLLAPAFMLGEVLMEVFIPFIIAFLIDKGINAGDIKMILLYGGILLVCAGISLTFGLLSGKYAAIASEGFAKNLRHDMFYKINEFSFRNIDKFSTSSLITRLTTDTVNVKNSYQMCIRIAVRAPLMFIFSLIMTVVINNKISLIFLIIVPVLFGLLILIAKIAHPYFEKVFKTYDELNNVVKENIEGVRVVKSYVTEDNEIKKFTTVSKKIYNLFTKAERIVCSNNALMDTAIYSCIMLVSYLGAKSIVAGSLSCGELTSLFTYSISILASLIMLSMIYVMIIIAIPSIKRIEEIIDEKIDIKSPVNGITELNSGSIEFKDVDFSYVNKLNKMALKDISLNINSGESIGIIGPTGSGKSSLISLISRLYDTTQGEVLVGGKNVKDYDLKVLRDNVAVVLQKNVLFSGTVRDNLKWGNVNASDEEITEALEISCAKEFVLKLPEKLDYVLDAGGTNVSGGQKQRLCIARALLKKPKIIVFDDSTSACDTKTDSMIREKLASLMPDVTKIIIAQRISSVENLDRVIVMEEGKIIAFDKPKKLLKTCQIYKEVYESQKSGGKQNA